MSCSCESLWRVDCGNGSKSRKLAISELIKSLRNFDAPFVDLLVSNLEMREKERENEKKIKNWIVKKSLTCRRSEKKRNLNKNVYCRDDLVTFKVFFMKKMISRFDSKNTFFFYFFVKRSYMGLKEILTNGITAEPSNGIYERVR